MTSSALSSSMAATRSRTVVAVAARGVNRMCAGLADGGVARPWRSSSSSSSLLSSIRSHKTHDKSVLPITATPLRVTCMANPRRVAKVQQQMRREISNMLQTDKVSAARKIVSQKQNIGDAESAQKTKQKNRNPKTCFRLTANRRTTTPMT